MKACPNCHFLVTDDTDRCTVCKQPVDAEPAGAPSGPWKEAPPAAEASARSVHQRARRPVTVRGRRRNLGLLSIGGVLIVAAVVFAFVYRMNTGADAFSGLLGLDRYRIEVSESDWAPYRDPAGRFSLELPGTPQVERPTIDTGAGPVQVETVVTEEPVVTVVSVATIPAGAQVDLQAAMEGFAEGGASSGLQDGIVTQSNPVATPYGPGIRGRIEGIVDGKRAVMAAQVFVSGPDLYVVGAIGPEPQTATVLDVQDRMSSTLAIPAA